MKTSETNWHTADGIPIYANAWEPDTEPRSIVCLLHGLGEHIMRYEHMASVFTGKGYIVFGADLRGHGRSGGKRGHIPSGKAILSDIDLIVEHARKNYPQLPVFLFGHSLGGMLALYYSLQRKPDIKGVISTSPGLRNSLAEQPVKLAAAKLLGTLFPRMSLHSGLNANTLSSDESVIRKYKMDPLVHGRLTLGFGKTMLQSSNWTMNHAGEFSLPLLLMHGKADKLTYASGSREFATRAGKICRLILWDDALHELHHEPQKDRVFEAEFSWMNEQLE